MNVVRRISRYAAMALLVLILTSCTRSGSKEQAFFREEPSEESSETSIAEPPTDDSPPEESSDNSKKDPGTSGFDVSEQRINWINWDIDTDGEDEEIEFERIDLGNEAPSFIEITVYDGEEQFEEIIASAYGLFEVIPEEDADGPYLLIKYALGDYDNHDAEGQCTLRMRDRTLEIEYQEEQY